MSRTNAGLMCVLPLIGIFTLTAAAEDSLCGEGETVYFSCKVSNVKFVSLCGNAYRDPNTPGAADNFWMQYRFGPLGKPELVYPRTKQNALAKFWFEYHHFYQGFSHTLGFKINSFTYEIDVSPDGDKPFIGVRVYQSKPGSTETKGVELPCESNQVVGDEFTSIISENAP